MRFLHSSPVVNVPLYRTLYRVLVRTGLLRQCLQELYPKQGERSSLHEEEGSQTTEAAHRRARVARDQQREEGQTQPRLSHGGGGAG